MRTIRGGSDFGRQRSILISKHYSMGTYTTPSRLRIQKVEQNAIILGRYDLMMG